QVLPPSADFYASCTDFLMAAKGDSHFLYVADDDADGDCVSLLLLERLIRKGKSYETVPGYADIATYNFKPGQSYVIVSDLNKRAEISKLLADVEKIIDKNPAVEISVIGRPTWVVYADALKSAMQKADTYIPSRFYMDSTEPKVAEFEKTFAENFGAAPLKSFPGYAAMGYDIARGLLPILAGRGELTDTSSATGALQLDLSLSRRQPWNGLLNSVVYLVHLTPYNTVDKIRL
ncbi:MAG: hypothetical protein K2M14_01395, partial [Muribaculaceae bacterium]|nr:hypothetical protein [Muribaculaceae bacterium]